MTEDDDTKQTRGEKTTDLSKTEKEIVTVRSESEAYMTLVSRVKDSEGYKTRFFRSELDISERDVMLFLHCILVTLSKWPLISSCVFLRCLLRL